MVYLFARHIKPINILSEKKVPMVIQSREQVYRVNPKRGWVLLYDGRVTVTFKSASAIEVKVVYACGPLKAG
jgi:hypothetical protein